MPLTLFIFFLADVSTSVDSRNLVRTKLAQNYSYDRSISTVPLQRLATLEGSNLRGEAQRNVQLSSSSGKRLNVSLPSRVHGDYCGKNLLLTRQPGERSFMSRKSGFLKQCKNNARLSQSLPTGHLANYSGGNLLLKRKRTDTSFKDGNDRTVTAPNTSSNLNVTIPKTSINEDSAKHVLPRGLPKDDVRKETRSSSEKQLNTSLSLEVSERSDSQHQTLSKPRLSLDNTATSILFHDLSFKYLPSSTPKRKITHSNQGNVSDIESDSDPDYVPPNDPDSEEGEECEEKPESEAIPKDHNDLVFESDHEEMDEEDIDNDAMEIVIGDAKALTDFTLSEYFEKYRNNTIISDGDLNDCEEMKSDMDKENEGNFFLNNLHKNYRYTAKF